MEIISEECLIIPEEGDISLQDLMKYPIEEIMKYEWYYDIPGYEGRYQISNYGSCYGLKRGEYLTRHLNKKENRYRFTLFKNGHGKEFNAARLVLLTYKGLPPKNKDLCCHKDGNSSNDRLDNLYWGSHFDNERDKRFHGRQRFGESHPSSILTNKEVIEIRRLREEDNITFQKIADKFGVSKSNIIDICQYKIWDHI